MSTVSIIFGVLAVLGYFVFVLSWGQSACLFWGSLAASAIALVTGFLTRTTRAGKIGLLLGAFGVVVGILMITWFTLVV